MTKRENQLAAALKALLDAPEPCDCGPQGCGRDSCPEDERGLARLNALSLLAELDKEGGQ